MSIEDLDLSGEAGTVEKNNGILQDVISKVNVLDKSETLYTLDALKLADMSGLSLVKAVDGKLLVPTGTVTEALAETGLHADDYFYDGAGNQFEVTSKGPKTIYINSSLDATTTDREILLNLDKNDGSANADAINKAIDIAANLKESGSEPLSKSIILPPGEFPQGGSILTLPHTTLKSLEGFNTALILEDGVNATQVTNVGNGDVSSVTLKNLILDGNRSGQTGSFDILSFVNTHNSLASVNYMGSELAHNVLENIILKNGSGNGINMIGKGGSRLKNISVLDVTGNGVKLYSGDMEMDGIYIKRTGEAGLRAQVHDSVFNNINILLSGINTDAPGDIDVDRCGFILEHESSIGNIIKGLVVNSTWGHGVSLQGYANDISLTLRNIGTVLQYYRDFKSLDYGHGTLPSAITALYLQNISDSNIAAHIDANTESASMVNQINYLINAPAISRGSNTINIHTTPNSSDSSNTEWWDEAIVGRAGNGNISSSNNRTVRTINAVVVDGVRLLPEMTGYAFSSKASKQNDTPVFKQLGRIVLHPSNGRALMAKGSRPEDSWIYVDTGEEAYTFTDADLYFTKFVSANQSHAIFEEPINLAGAYKVRLDVAWSSAEKSAIIGNDTVDQSAFIINEDGTITFNVKDSSVTTTEVIAPSVTVKEMAVELSGNDFIFTIDADVLEVVTDPVAAGKIFTFNCISRSLTQYSNMVISKLHAEQNSVVIAGLLMEEAFDTIAFANGVDPSNYATKINVAESDIIGVGNE